MNVPQPLDAYIRVSQVAGREGESFQSPGQQRDAIVRWASAQGVEIRAWHQDMDRTGANMERPGFEAVLERVRRGETGGVVVARLDRFSRASVRDGLSAVEEIRGHGGQVVALDVAGLDSADPFGEFALTMMLAMGRMELRRIGAGWDRARRRAIARGVQIGPIPFGYRADEERRLRIHAREASLVRRLFGRRAAGESPGELARWLDGAAPKRDGGEWSHNTVTSMLASRTYLGRVAHGRHVNEAAHEPIVSAELWRRAHLGPTALPAREGGYALSGLLRCASCGHRMGGSKRGPGARQRIYRCYGHYASGDCPRPVYVSAPNVEDEVARQLIVALEGRRENEEPHLPAARRAVEDATEALRLYLRLTPESHVGREAHKEGVAEHERRLWTSENRLAGLQASEQPDGMDLRELAASWLGLAWRERRTTFRTTLDAVVVRRPPSRHSRYPLAPRIRVLLRGEAPAELRALSTVTCGWTWNGDSELRPEPLTAPRIARPEPDPP